MTTRTTPTPAVVGDLYELADAIGEGSAREDLMRVAEAIEDPALRQRWSGVDLTRHFIGEDLQLDVSQPSRFLRTLDRLRVVLIFMPILWTWWGVFWAMNAYSALIRDSSGPVEQSLVALWQDGFEGRTWITLGRLAIVDVALILVAVIVIWFASRGMDEHERQVRIRRTEFGARLRSALFRATEALRQDVVATPDDIREAFTAAVQSLSSLGQAVDLTRGLADFLPRFEGATDVFAQASASLQEAIERLDEKGTRIAGSTSDLVTGSARLAELMQESLEALTSAGASLAATGDSQVAASDGLARAGEHLATTLALSGEAASQLRGVLETASVNLLDAQAVTRASTESLQRGAQEAGQISREIQTELRALAGQFAASATAIATLVESSAATVERFAVLQAVLLDQAERSLGRTSRSPSPRDVE